MTSLQSPALRFAVLTGAAVIAMSVTATHRAAAGICPQYLAQFCVVEKDGFRHTEWTNPCFVHERGGRVLHAGVCEGPICTDHWAPVCSINPGTGRAHTYSNLCWSDVANATLLHKGACLHKK